MGVIFLRTWQEIIGTPDSKFVRFDLKQVVSAFSLYLFYF